MKTNVLLLDTLKGMRSLIFSAFSLSSQQKRKLKIVYIEDFNWVSSADYVGVAPGSMGAGLQYAEEKIKQDYEQAEGKIKEYVTEYLETFPQTIHYEYEVREYNRLEYVEDVINQYDDVLLMMSNYSSISESPGGRINFPNILDKVACPVLVIPDSQHYLNFNKIVYATAMHQEDLAALQKLTALFDADHPAELTVFHHSKSHEFRYHLKWTGFKTLIQEAIPNVKINFHLDSSDDVEIALQHYVDNNKPDLIVTLKEKKGFFENLFFSSQTHELIKHFNKPVLVYHEDNLAKLSQKFF